MVSGCGNRVFGHPIMTRWLWFGYELVDKHVCRRCAANLWLESWWLVGFDLSRIRASLTRELANSFCRPQKYPPCSIKKKSYFLMWFKEKDVCPPTFFKNGLRNGKIKKKNTVK